MGKRTVFVGNVYQTNNFGECTVIGYNSSTDVTVKFNDTGYITTTTNNLLLRGKVRDRYALTVCGVGYLGDEVEGFTQKEYSIWYNMIANCYDDNRKFLSPHYGGCSVSKRWLCFANFLKDLPKVTGYDLFVTDTDNKIVITKGLKYRGNREFSLKTCMFAHKSTNSSLMALHYHNK